ncbi:hypothetical protein, partial [Vibrio anguillarum]
MSDSTDQKSKLEGLVNEIEMYNESIQTSLSDFNDRFDATEQQYSEKLDETTSNFESKYQVFSKDIS